MENKDRREFLKKSILGISGAALLPRTILGKTAHASVKAPSPTLSVRLMGRTGIKTPLISMGTSNAVDPGFIRSAYEAGVKLFFSATYYGEGNNEKLVGEALKGLPRDSYVIGTAAPPDGMDMRSGTLNKSFNTEEYIKKAEGSLKRFGLDYVDIFLFPYAGKRETVMHESVLKAVQLLKKQGKTRFVGIATHADMEEALRAAADTGVYDVAMPAYNFKVTSRESMDDAISYAAKAGIGIVAMKTTAGTSRSKNAPPLNTDAALKWVLQNENVASIISGMTSLEQLNKNLTMIRNLKMTEKEKADLKLASLDSETGLYCRQCSSCLAQCPYNPDIPAIMRSYMYAYGYKDLTQAWYTLSDAKIPEGLCQSCSSCAVKCRSGFDVKEKIRDISRLKDFPKEFFRG
jgi:uncharacterized protein